MGVYNQWRERAWTRTGYYAHLRDQDGLILALCNEIKSKFGFAWSNFHSLTRQHALIGPVCYGEDVWRHLIPSLVDVHLDGCLRVDGEPPVRVHSHAEQSRVCL